MHKTLCEYNNFTVKEIDLDLFESIYNIMEEEFVNFDQHESMVENDIKKVFDNIEYSFKQKQFKNIGLFFKNELIGVTTINLALEKPWVSTYAVKTNFRHSIGNAVLAHYIFNVLFEGIGSEFGTYDPKYIKKYVKALKNRAYTFVLKKETKDRLNKIFN